MTETAPFLHTKETGSTNQDLLDRVRSGRSHPTAILTDHQTAGRGRLGRAWANESGQNGPVQAMLGSTRVDWSADHPSMSLMPFAAGLAAFDACERWAQDSDSLSLKWPNDLVAPRDPPGSEAAGWFRKMGGILVEAMPVHGSDHPESTAGQSIAVIVGVGINIWPVEANGPVPVDACSLSEFSSSPPTNVQLFDALLDQIKHWVAVLRSDPAELMDRYRDRCATPGQTVRFADSTGPQIAKAIKVMNTGALLVELNSGGRTEVTTGDVHIVPTT